MSSHPDFLCIGAQKGATTWLHRSLNACPRVFLPAIKELHYFSQLHDPESVGYAQPHRRAQCREATEHFRPLTAPLCSHAARLLPPRGRVDTPAGLLRGLPPFQRARKLQQLAHIGSGDLSDEWYRGIYRFARPGQRRGEICPSYMALPEEGIRHILAINPEIRVLLIVRDPLDRIWSHLRMHMSYTDRGMDTRQILDGSFDLAPYLRFSDYARAIPRWESLLQDGTLRVMLFDEICERPEASLRETLSFIGIDDHRVEPGSCDPVFVGDQLDLPPELGAVLMERLAPQYAFLRDRFPRATERWLHDHEEALQVSLSG